MVRPPQVYFFFLDIVPISIVSTVLKGFLAGHL
jgi:hypothetical protein